MTAKTEDAPAARGRGQPTYAVLQLRTSRVRDPAGKKIARGRLIAVSPTKAEQLVDKRWAVKVAKGFDPRDVLDLIDPEA